MPSLHTLLCASTILAVSFSVNAQAALITIDSPTPSEPSYAIGFSGSVEQAGDTIGDNSMMVFSYSGASIDDFEFTFLGGLTVEKPSGGARNVTSITKSGSTITMVLTGALPTVPGSLRFNGNTTHPLSSGGLPATAWSGSLSTVLLQSSVTIRGNSLGTTPPNAVPEPSSLAILGVASLGLVATGLRQRRRHRNSA